MLKDTLSTKSEYLLTKDTTELRAEDGETCQSISVTTWIVERIGNQTVRDRRNKQD